MSKTHNNRINLISLLALGFFSMSTILIAGYLNKTPLQTFMDPNSFSENLMENLPIVIPLLFILWILFVNRWQRFFTRLSFYTALFLSYLIAVVVFGLSLSLFIESIMGKEYEMSIVSTTIILLFITTLFNYFISLFEKKRLNMKNIWILMISFLVIPLFCFVWQKFLTIFISGEFVDSWILNGGLFFSFIIYEGLFYLWLKGKISLNPKEYKLSHSI